MRRRTRPALAVGPALALILAVALAAIGAALLWQAPRHGPTAGPTPPGPTSQGPTPQGPTPQGPTPPGPTPPGPTPRTALHLVAFGDLGTTSDTTAVLRTTAGLAPDAALVLGDLSYGEAGQEDAWCDYVLRELGEGFPFQLVSGNHEADGENGSIDDFAACLPNELPGLVGTYGRQWYVDVPAGAPVARVVMISPDLEFPDGTWRYDAGTSRYTWTAAAVGGARAAGIPWVVVGMHKPCLSVGEYDCKIGRDLMGLLMDGRVDLVLTGHEHLYQRTHQVGPGPGCDAVVPGEFDADCVRDDDDAFTGGAGTVFATVGTGGVAQRPVDDDDPEMPYMAATSGEATATWGLLDLDVTATTLEARFVRASGGSSTDAFTITRRSP